LVMWNRVRKASGSGKWKRWRYDQFICKIFE
jgi:hypothetical protein